MAVIKLTKNELELIEKYKKTNNQEIALFFYNKWANDIVNIIYARINLKFTSIPYDRNDLFSIVWKSIKESLKEFDKEKYPLWSIVVNKSYIKTIREVQKYLKNTELILNIAKSWDTISDKHHIYKNNKNLTYTNKNNIKKEIDELIDWLAANTKTYPKLTIKKLIYLKSLGFSTSEIATKFKTDVKNIRNMIKIMQKILKKYY